MKKIIIASLFLGAAFSNAQTTESTEMSETPSFKRWAIDVGAGVQKPTRPFTQGFTNTPSFYQADLGVRYMITRSFGIGVEGGFNNIKSDDDSSVEFDNKLYRVGLEGIVNLGNFVGLKEATNRFGIIAHGGMGVGFFDVQDPVNIDGVDHMLNFTAGITPQVRLTDNVAIFGDLTIIGTTRNNYGWDGGVLPSDVRGFEGMLVNASVGLTFYLGKGDVPADFAIDPTAAKIDELSKAFAKMESDIADDDQDGVPNYLDRDNTTESGVAVDNKGRAIDLNKNGIPDEMESALDSRYSNKGNGANGSDGNTQQIVKTLINGGYVNVYFQFDSTKPATYSLSAINTIVKYMKENPSASATLTGYADELGAPGYNKSLSERRAKMVHDVLVASGVSASRLTHTGGGEDASVNKDSDDARQLVRRVTFKV
ncbi:MAG: OmpA family protein, partial [Nonlabens sp.]|nr:OmpA family protein [Nonlabens sp.]